MDNLHLGGLQTPCLLVDEARMQRNMTRMRDHLATLNCPLRPHVKTCKNIDIARRMLEGQPGGIAVSTLAEAEYFQRHGMTDVLYAVGIAPGRLRRAAALLSAGLKLTLVLDHPQTAEAVVAAARAHGGDWQVWLEIDTDGMRAGFRPDDKALLPTARTLARGGVTVAGVMTHAGGSYACRDTDCIRRFAATERDGAVHAAQRLREAGMDASTVSTGSTPTALLAQNLDGVTEIRAGVYVFQDLVMAGLGVCDTRDIALSVLTEVIGHRRAGGEVIADAGWMALSRDRGTAGQAMDQGYGLVCGEDGEALGDLIVSGTTQEHGVITRQDGAPVELRDFPIGRRLRILPNHACATAAQHAGYFLLESGGGQPWLPRMSGW